MLNSVMDVMSSGSFLGYFLQVLPVVCLAGLLCIGIRLFQHRKHREALRPLPEVLRVLFVCYLTGLISLVVLPANFWLNVYDGLLYGWWNEFGTVFRFAGANLVPSVVKCLMGTLPWEDFDVAALLGNVALFVPMGVFLPLVTPMQNWKRLLPAAALIPLACELVQAVFDRSFDIDDLLCNFLGVVLGAALCFAVKRLTRRAE